MRPFSELAPGDLFFWQAKTWKKIKPQPRELRYADPYNAVKMTNPLAYATVPGWVTVPEPIDVADNPDEIATLRAEIERLTHEVAAAEAKQGYCYTCGKEITAMAEVTP